MPFQSKAQARYLYSQHPEIAGRWEKHTSRKKRKRLPEHVGKARVLPTTTDPHLKAVQDTALAHRKIWNGPVSGLASQGEHHAKTAWMQSVHDAHNVGGHSIDTIAAHSPHGYYEKSYLRKIAGVVKKPTQQVLFKANVQKSQLMPSGLLVALAGKEPTANLGYKAITQMSRRERDILRGEMLIKPDRFRENGRDSREAVSYVSQHRSNPEPEALANARRLVGRTSRHGVGQTLGVTFPTKPGHAEIVTMPRREFNRFSAAENRGIKPGKPRVSGRDLQVRTMTHEQRHAEEIRSKPRRAELRDTWHAVHNPARREAQHAATEGRAVGHTNRKLGPKDEMYDDVYKPTKKGLRRNKYDKTPRETRAYNAAKEHPDSTLRQYRRDQGGRFSKMSHAVRRYELAKSQLVGQGFKAISEMAPKERNLLRRQITHNPVERFREPAKRISAEVRQDIKPGARRAHAEYARQAIDEGETLGVAYRTGPGKATTKLADPPAFDREARMQNKLARAQGVKKPGYTGQQMRDVTHTHELHHAAELKSMPRKTELQHAYTGVANPARADAHHAAMEGRAVGQANAVHGPLPSNYDQTYKVPRGVKAKQNMAGSTRREATAYHAAKANPNTLLHRFGKKMPSQLETPTQRYQRHQHQAAAALTATAAVPALMALRSGRMASQAIAARNPAEHAIHASSQLKHAASATALGGLAGAANAMPTPHRLLNQNSKTKKIKVASKISGHSPAHGKSPASGYTKEGFGKSNAAQTERTKHYRRMSNTMGAMGAIGTGLASGAKVVGHLEGKGKDPVGFTHRTKNAYRTRPMPAPMQEKVLNHFSQVHANQAKAVGMVTVPALGAAAAYKYKQRQSMKKSFTPKTKQRAKQAGAVGAGASVAGLGALAVPGGLGDTKIMGHDVHAAGRGALAAHRRIGAHNAGTEHLDEDALRFARTQRKVGLRSMAIKGPATVGAAGIAAAGGAAGYEVGRHALATAKIKGRERRRG